jgi:hypothetical protein
LLLRVHWTAGGNFAATRSVRMMPWLRYKKNLGG